MPSLSPTHFAVRESGLNRDLERARRDGDIPAMQRALAALTELKERKYGIPRKGKAASKFDCH